jgi:hypothetical protein
MRTTDRPDLVPTRMSCPVHHKLANRFVCRWLGTPLAEGSRPSCRSAAAMSGIALAKLFPIEATRR